MTRDEISTILSDELGRIAPETDAATLVPGADLREELDIDSIDFLNLANVWSSRSASCASRNEASCGVAWKWAIDASIPPMNCSRRSGGRDSASLLRQSLTRARCSSSR